MTTPRIGDTVHYVADGGQIDLDSTERLPGHCRAAIVARVDDRGNPFLYVLPAGPFSGLGSITHRGVDYDPTTATDATPTTNGFTPGTWHHIH